MHMNYYWLIEKRTAGISTNTKPDSQISMKHFPLFLPLKKYF